METLGCSNGAKIRKSRFRIKWLQGGDCGVARTSQTPLPASWTMLSVLGVDKNFCPIYAPTSPSSLSWGPSCEPH